MSSLRNLAVGRHAQWAFAILALSGLTAAGEAPSGTTVITHGYEPISFVPFWAFEMADDIRDRAGGGRIFEYDKATGELRDCTRAACDDPPDESGETILVFDWADDSNEVGSGFSEAAAEALLAALVEASRSNPPRVNLSRLHLIGHSRGAVVHSEVTERLIAAGFPAPRQVTSLDPHDEGAFQSWKPRSKGSRAGFEDLDVNREHPEYAGNGIWAWKGIAYQDNYWRRGCALDPDGEEVAGAANFDMSEIGGLLENDVCHLEVPTWYRRTISLGKAPRGWFDSTASSCDGTSRTAPLAQTVDGFNFSRLGGGAKARCPDAPDRKQEVLFDWNLKEGLTNGDFDRSGSGGRHISGWSFHGGGGPAEVAFHVGDNDLLLRGGQWRRHNRFFLPPGATAIAFCRRVILAGSSDTLTLAIVRKGEEDRLAWTEELAGTTERECFTAPVLASERGSVMQLTFSLSDRANPMVSIDDVRLVVPARDDGQESEEK